MEPISSRRPGIRDLAYIAGLFIITRIALSALGVAMHVLWFHDPMATADDFASVWNIWDGHLYVEIAQSGYSAVPLNSEGMANYAFFPLYPAVIRMAALLVTDDLVASLIVSNVCLLVACVYIYKYVSLDADADEGTARRSVKYLILFPTAFLFSAVLTESLFVMLAVACLYYARKGNWLAAGVLGFLVPLARLPGLAIVVPLGYEYFRQHVPSPVRLSGLRRLLSPWLVALLLPFAGLGLWAAYNYRLAGDALAFLHIQSTWGGRFVIPPVELVERLDPLHGAVFTGAVFTVAALAVMIYFFRKVDFGAWLFGCLLIVIPLFSAQSDYSMLRYLVVVFPLWIIAAKVTKDRRTDIALTIIMIVLQAVLMAMWTCWSSLIV